MLYLQRLEKHKMLVSRTKVLVSGTQIGEAPSSQVSYSQSIAISCQ
jgi:hypothetical protein